MEKITDRRKIVALDSIRVASHIFWGLNKFTKGIQVKVHCTDYMFTFQTGGMMIDFVSGISLVSRSEWVEIDSTPDIEKYFFTLLDEAINLFILNEAENGKT